MKQQLFRFLLLLIVCTSLYASQSEEKGTVLRSLAIAKQCCIEKFYNNNPRIAELGFQSLRDSLQARTVTPVTDEIFMDLLFHLYNNCADKNANLKKRIPGFIEMTAGKGLLVAKEAVDNLPGSPIMVATPAATPVVTPAAAPAVIPTPSTAASLEVPSPASAGTNQRSPIPTPRSSVMAPPLKPVAKPRPLPTPSTSRPVSVQPDSAAPTPPPVPARPEHFQSMRAAEQTETAIAASVSSEATSDASVKQPVTSTRVRAGSPPLPPRRTKPNLPRADGSVSDSDLASTLASSPVAAEQPSAEFMPKPKSVKGKRKVGFAAPEEDAPVVITDKAKPAVSPVAQSMDAYVQIIEDVVRKFDPEGNSVDADGISFRENLKFVTGMLQRNDISIPALKSGCDKCTSADQMIRFIEVVKHLVKDKSLITKYLAEDSSLINDNKARSAIIDDLSAILDRCKDSEQVDKALAAVRRHGLEKTQKALELGKLDLNASTTTTGVPRTVDLGGEKPNMGDSDPGALERLGNHLQRNAWRYGIGVAVAAAGALAVAGGAYWYITHKNTSDEKVQT